MVGTIGSVTVGTYVREHPAGGPGTALRNYVVRTTVVHFGHVTVAKNLLNRRLLLHTASKVNDVVHT